MLVHSRETASYNEFDLTADIKAEFYGVKILAEYAWVRVDYDKPGVELPENTMLSGGSPLETFYTASNVGTASYLFLGYLLPLEKWIDPVQITPYCTVEYLAPNDTRKHTDFLFFAGGINVKPSVYVVLKAEYGYGHVINPIYGLTNKQTLAAQLAVAF